MKIDTYAEVVERWKVDLIVGRAKRLGFRRHDLEDAVQEIILDVINFEFEPDRSNGATEATALTSLIDNRLKALLRTKRRYQKLQERAAEEQQHVGCCCEGEPAVLLEDQQQLVLDVRQAIAQLPAQEQTACLALSQGNSVSAIAKQLVCCWPTANRIVSRIREHFEAIGLDGWILV